MEQVNPKRGTDGFGRRITYLRLSLTSQCQLNCFYCQPKKQKKCHGHQTLTLEEMTRLAKAFVHIGVRKIRLTGGEPLLYPNLIPLIKTLRTYEGVEEITLTTNGLLLHKKAKALKEAGLTRVNISLDTLDPKVYEQITGVNGFTQVMKGIEAAIEVGLSPIRLNVVLLKGVNDNQLPAFIEWTKHAPIDIRLIELMPIGEGLKLKDRYMSTDEVIRQFPALQALPENPDSVARYYQLPDAQGRIGIIPAVSHHFCNQCNRVRINAMGELKYCLLRDERTDLKRLVRFADEDIDLEEAIATLITHKPIGHEAKLYPKGNMYQIGG